MPKASNGGEQGHNFWDLALNGIDDTVTPAIVSFGQMGRDNTGTWRYLTASASGYLMVSGSFGSVSFSNDASNQPVSAKQGDANLLHVSAMSNDAGLLRVSSIGASGSSNDILVDGADNTLSASILRVSGTISAGQNALITYAQNRDDASNLRTSSISKDAGLMRVSAVGGTAGDNTLVDGITQTISATLTPISASPAGSVAGLVTNNFQSDAGKLLVSAKQGDAGLFHVSALGTFLSANQQISAVLLGGTANIGGVSAVQGSADQLRISALNQDANFMHVSGFSPDAGLFRISAIGGDANTLHTSAVQGDAGLLHTSAFSGTASQFVVSAVQSDATVLRISADLYPDTVGGLTVFQSLSVSASQNVKSTAGALYGYYLYNTDTHFNYFKFYNVSAAANIGTDTPLLTVGLPASAAANVEFPHGLAGFTNGINITATSGRPLDNTALPAASSMGAVLFYK